MEVAFLKEWAHHPNWQQTRFIGFTATPGTKGMSQVFDDLVIGATIKELTDQGVLVKANVFAPPSGILPDLKGMRQQYAATTGAVDYVEGELAKRMLQPTLMADAVMTYQALAMGLPTLVYAVNCLHAKTLQQKYIEAGIPAEYIDAHTPMLERV